MSAFTRVGCSIWDWEPFTELSMNTRVLWSAFYTSAEAKRHVPGLWQGSLASMADAARMPIEMVRSSLDELLERETVEYDPKTRVLRLCELPDTGEFPSSGKVILSWWTKFKTVPDCPVRNAHVETLAWLMTEGSKRSGNGPPSSHHTDAWSKTFSQILVPSKRRRGLKRLSDDSDTSTRVQPSLFPSGASSISRSDSDSSYPQDVGISVDNSASSRQMNKNNGPERVSDTVSDTVSHTLRIPDPGSRIPDLLSYSGEGGGGGGHESSNRPALTLVPPYGAADVLRELRKGPWDPSCDQSHQDALGAMIPRWGSSGWGMVEFALLAEYNRHIGRVWNARLLVGCDFAAEIGMARRALDWRDVRMATMRTVP